jgi:hypothetical protein
LTLAADGSILAQPLNKSCAQQKARIAPSPATPILTRQAQWMVAYNPNKNRTGYILNCEGGFLGAKPGRNTSVAVNESLAIKVAHPFTWKFYWRDEVAYTFESAHRACASWRPG